MDEKIVALTNNKPVEVNIAFVGRKLEALR